MNFLETAQDLQTLAKVCGHNNKKKKTKHRKSTQEVGTGKILSEPSKFKNQKNCGIIGEELPGSDAQGMMYLCDGPCTSSGLKILLADPVKKRKPLLWHRGKLNSMSLKFDC